MAAAEAAGQESFIPIEETGTLDDEDEVVPAENFEELATLCERGATESVKETLVSNPRAESVWVHQRRATSLSTPLHIACCWGHSEVVRLLIGSNANPLLHSRICKKDWCQHGFPTTPAAPCPGFVNPENSDDLGCSALQVAKNKGFVLIVKLLKHHILNCVVHQECVEFRHKNYEEFNSGGVPGGLSRDYPRDDPTLLFPAPLLNNGADTDGPNAPALLWPLKHFGKVFRAASEGDCGLVKSLVVEWNQSQEFAADDDEGDAALQQDGGDAQKPQQPTDRRPDPTMAKHPTTWETLLHYAARQPNPEMAKYLLARGCDATAGDRHGATPLWCACDSGRFEGALLIAAKVDLRELRRPQGVRQTSPGETALANRHTKLAAWIQEEITRRLRNRGS